MYTMKLCIIGLIAALVVLAVNAKEKYSANEKDLESKSSVTEQDHRSRELFIDEEVLEGQGLVFQRSYISITKSENFKTILREQPRGELKINTMPSMEQSEFLLDDGKLKATGKFPELPFISKITIVGLTQTQSGGVYDPVNVQLVNVPNGVPSGKKGERTVGNPTDNVGLNLGGQQYAGGVQPKFIPARDPGFFFDGQCVATAGDGATQIKEHSCLFNLCLGGGGANCLALYCGSAFQFDPLTQPGNTFQNTPNLPPSYPCVIIGGTNTFQGARGNVDVTTLTGRTSPLVGKNGQQIGAITQRLNVVSNVALPPAP